LTFVNFAIICDRLRNTPFETDIFVSDNRSEKEQSLMNKHKLIIDDLGAEKRSDYSDDLLMRLVEHRYSAGLYTGFTSNISLGSLPYDARIISRIVGMVDKNKFEITGKDHRV
jgi:DNA replication protein DnaC